MDSDSLLVYVVEVRTGKTWNPFALYMDRERAERGCLHYEEVYPRGTVRLTEYTRVRVLPGQP